ncbi:hypothetical protein [Actinotignum sanguinis]|nr:hypothetical protein [Actinotignum sanguinis]MDE1552040.1 hypothetical protein [Actinotignum sanguinis]
MTFSATEMNGIFVVIPGGESAGWRHHFSINSLFAQRNVSIRLGSYGWRCHHMIIRGSYTSLDQVLARQNEILDELRTTREDYNERAENYWMNDKEAALRPEFEALEGFVEFYREEELKEKELAAVGRS